MEMEHNHGIARAKASCTRCHKRKKRCDRILPCCRNCRAANVRCSLEDDDGQNASFPIAYVRGLEQRLRAMGTDPSETTLLASEPVDQDATMSMHTRPYEDYLMNNMSQTRTEPDAQAENIIAGPQPFTHIEPQQQPTQAQAQHVHQPQHQPEALPLSQSLEPAQMQVLSQQPVNQAAMAPAATENSPTFAQELQTLSLEAAAERHLGSTSGLSFATLTQKVLRRLTPDKADFVFAPNQEDANGASFFNLNFPSELFNDDVYQGLSETISVHPLLFGDLFLSDITSLSTDIQDLAWPTDDAHVQHLVDFYFAHSHTLYPFLERGEVMRALDSIRQHPQDVEAQPLQSFRLWMVLAIGSTAYSSVSLTEESESMLYFNKALQYADQALEQDEMSALEALMLQVSYSFFNQLGPNTWFLVGTAARLALGLGLNTSLTYDKLPFEAQQRRKRIFFSIYMMDRLVSIALGRPFAIHDDDVDVPPFEDIDDGCARTEGSSPLIAGHPTLMAVPLHILKLRQLASTISRQVYSAKKSIGRTPHDRQQILKSLHQELLEWRRGMPFPLPDIAARTIPHLHTLWYDFNYYTHLAMIYRPSPLCPTPDPEGLKLLGTAAFMSLRQAYEMHQQRRFAYNWLNFLAIFTSTLSLVYAITAQPDKLPLVLQQSKAIDDLELAIQLFEAFGIKFAAARNIQRMIAEISRQYKEIRDNKDV